MPCVFETCWTPCFHAGAGHQGLASERLESRWQIVGRCRWLRAELQDDHLLLAAILADPGQQTNPTSMMGPYFVFTFLLFNSIFALPPNFEDIDLASDQPDGEVEELILS